MSNKFTFERRCQGPFEHEDPLARLLHFYEVNHYTAHDPLQRAQDPITLLDLSRGSQGAGWLSSDMTKLLSKVQLRLEDEGQLVIISYEVDTSGQVLKQKDREFWDQEAQGAQDFLNLAEDQEPADLTIAESTRAQDTRKGSMALGLKVGVGIGVLIFLGAYLAHNLRLI